MHPEPHRRLIVLLLMALLVPCAVLTLLGVRMIRQERELSAKRLADERQALTTQVRQELLSRLDHIKLQVRSALHSQPLCQYKHPSVALVARIAGRRIVPPWAEASDNEDFRTVMGAPEFAGKVQEGEHQEFRQRLPDSAAVQYQEALRLAKHPVQTAYARLLLARALAKAGRLTEARSQYLKLMAVPTTLVDDQGVPFRLYAASRLAGDATTPVVLRELLEGPGWLTPSAYYLIAELAESSAGKAVDLRKEIRARIRDVEQVQALQSELPNLVAFERAPEEQPVWIRYGEPAWLVNVTPVLADSPLTVIAVRAERVLESLPAGRLRFLTAKGPGAWPAGEGLPGLYLAFVPPLNEISEGWSLRQSFYLAALLLVLTTTLIGAYLLWRDVRREWRMGELRAQFVSSVSHELKTPLTAIRMFAETLRMRRWKDEQIQQEYLDTIVNESQRLARLVDNVLDFSRIERGKRIYNQRPASLAEVVRAAARAVQYPLGQQGFRLNAEIEDGLPAVKVDSDALEQAILNLLTNAMKYSGDSRDIGLRLRRVDGRACIEVSDQGIGIPPEEHKRIFEKFYRVPTRENQLIPGTGLGLTLVEHIAKAHGGEVKLESQSGQGSTFSIELPLGDER
jgi:signal transduction histidine kinase